MQQLIDLESLQYNYIPTVILSTLCDSTTGSSSTCENQMVGNPRTFLSHQLKVLVNLGRRQNGLAAQLLYKENPWDAGTVVTSSSSDVMRADGRNLQSTAAAIGAALGSEAKRLHVSSNAGRVIAACMLHGCAITCMLHPP